MLGWLPCRRRGRIAETIRGGAADVVNGVLVVAEDPPGELRT